MGTTSSAIFTGSSQFSQDFQNVVNRAVSLASLPMRLLTNRKTSLTNESTAMSGLDTRFQSLQTSVNAIESALSGAALQATVSDDTKLSASVTAGAMEGVYTINIADPGTCASSLTNQPWDGTGNHSYGIKFNGVVHGLSTSDTGAAGVAKAINDTYGDYVRATVVNVSGDSQNPDYRIALQGAQLGNLDPQIYRDGASIADGNAKVTGSKAAYTINHSNNAAQSTSRTISLANGINVTLMGGTGSVTITVARPATALSNALSSFASAYNAAVDEVAKQRGASGSALAGDPIVNALSASLRSIGTYGASTGSVDGLKTLGLDLDKNGHLTFDPFAFATLDTNDDTAVATFLGSSAKSGFLKWATDTLTGIEDSSSGSLTVAETSVQSQISTLTDQISTQQERVDRLQTQLNNQMAAADALVSSMEQQYNYISAMFQAMRAAAQQYK